MIDSVIEKVRIAPATRKLRPLLLPTWLRLQRNRVWQSYHERTRASRTPRRFTAFCVGLPKTGTHSIADMLVCRSEHEPEKNILAYLVDRQRRGTMTIHEQARILRTRDTRLWLELESNWMLGLVIEPIVQALPDSRFVLTVRNPRSWLESTINQSVTAERPEVFQRMFEVMFGGHEFDEHDGSFREHGLYSVRGYLGHWAEQTARVLAAVPPDNLLVVRTREITQRAEEVAAFVGAEGIEQDSTRRFVRKDKRLLLDNLLDEAYLSDAIQRLTGDVHAQLETRISMQEARSS